MIEGGLPEIVLNIRVFALRRARMPRPAGFVLRRIAISYGGSPFVTTQSGADARPLRR